MSITVQALLTIVGAIVAAAILLLATGRWRSGGALALFASFTVATLHQIGEAPSFPPTDATHAFVWLGALALAAAVAKDFAPRAAGVALVALAATLVLCEQIHFLIGTRRFPTTANAALWMAGCSAAAIAVWFALDLWAARNETGPTIALPLTVVAGGGAAAVASSSLVHGLQAGSLSAALGVSVVYSLWKSSSTVGRSALAVALTLLPGIWAVGYLFDDLPARSALLLTFAPLAVWVTEIPPLRTRKPWLKAAIAAAVVLVVVAAAVIPAMPKMDAE